MRRRAAQHHPALTRLSVLPFERLFGLLALIAGVFGVFHIGNVGQDPLSKLLPEWLLTLVQVEYALSGAAILIGLGANRVGWTGFGLTLLATSSVIQEIGLFTVVGLDTRVFVALIFNALIVWTCWSRLQSLRRGETIIRARIEKP